MNAIKIISSLLITGSLLLTACNNSESGKEKESGDKETIRKMSEAYNSHLIKGEYEAMIEYIYPGIFEEFPKEELISSMKNSLHSNDFDVTIRKIIIDSVSEVYPYNADKYASVIHRADATFQFKDSTPPETLDAYCANFKMSFGEANVKCNVAAKNFDIIIPDISLFIYSDKYKKWHTLGTTSTEDVNKFVPLEMQEKLGVSKKL